MPWLLVGILWLFAGCSDSETRHSPDGGIYSGPLRDGKFHGRGEIIWENGYHYRGDFFEGYFHGKGELTYSDGAKYQGDFVRGLEQGQGEFFFPDGGHYQGDIIRGEFHGSGEFRDAEGTLWRGEFANGQPIQGTASHQDGQHYEGGFADWTFQGRGTLTMPDGGRLSGQFQNGFLNGTGEYHSPSGEQYQGEFQYGRYHGNGVHQTAEGDLYTGEFQWGLYHGKGHMRLADAVDGIREYEGTWRRGTLVESPNRELVYDEGTAVEAMLYRQTDLLEKQLAYLRYEDPEEIDLYYLGVAGDGGQEVFRREILYARNLFEQRFQSPRRSVLLVNSRRTHSQYPLATRESLRRALRGIASKMNRDQDILFVFFSSHGSRGHQLHLDQPGLSLPNLAAADLGKMVGELGIRHKLLLISACYAGGFIPALDDGNTVIFTAADADKQSFGCSDRNEFTHFGKAYFREGLAGGFGFLESFDRAKNLVTEWENAEGQEPSEPQKRAPKSAVDYLEGWLRNRTAPNTNQHVTPKPEDR